MQTRSLANFVGFISKQMNADKNKMKELSARICRDYLHGSWKSVNSENIGFKHIRWVANFHYSCQGRFVEMWTSCWIHFAATAPLHRIVYLRIQVLRRRRNVYALWDTSKVFRRHDKFPWMEKNIESLFLGKIQDEVVFKRFMFMFWLQCELIRAI